MPVVYKNDPDIQETTSCQYMRGSTSGSCAQTPNSVYIDTTSTSYFKSHWMEGRTIPGWQKMRNEGVILPMTIFKQWQYETTSQLRDYDFCDASNRRWWWVNNYSPTRLSWCHTNSIPVSVPDLPDLQYLVQQAASSIASSGWDALTFLRELHHLRRMFSGVVTKLHRLIQGRTAGQAYSLWLEGRYGWRVLTYDIRDLHEVLLNYREKRTRYNQKHGNKYTDLETRDGTDVTGDGTFMYSESISMTVNMRATVVADIQIPKLQFNPLVTAWEVTRLSFVVDWLINVGQALNAATFLLLVKDYQAAGGFRIDFESAGISQLETPKAGYTYYSEMSSGYSGQGYYEERIPMKVSSLPRLKLRLDYLKAIDLMALIAQKLVQRR